MPKDTMFVVPPAENRQKMIEAMDLGESVSISRRISLDMGLKEDTITQHMAQLRGTLDQQAKRARTKYRERTFTVEGGTFISRASALLITCVCTRTA